MYENILNESLQEKIDMMLRSEINEIVTYNKVRHIVTEELHKHINYLINEKDDANIKRKAVMSMLKDDKYNHAELMRHIYHPKDKSEEDTYRSLFSKKATGKPDANGAIRHFTDEEVNKLYELLRSH